MPSGLCNSVLYCSVQPAWFVQCYTVLTNGRIMQFTSYLLTRYEACTCVIQNISSGLRVSGGDTLLFDMAQLLQYDGRMYVNGKYVQL
jgi:hypothetical protein